MSIGGGPVRSIGAPLVRIEGIVKTFGGIPAVNGVSLDIVQGEFFALLGPSGCGKTTLLRLLAGFETPDSGRILLDGEDIVPIPPYRRPVNMMFQSYALFPHLTVAGNVAFGLRQERLPRAEIDARVSAMMALVKIEALAGRKPHQLSGGQRQRVALARALVKRPKVFLLDEPLAALDKRLRAQTQFELKELQRRLGLTFVIVTHDQEEAMIMADRIGVMDHGRLKQVATPSEIYERPNSRWVAQFIGEANVLEGSIAAGESGPIVDTAAGRLHVADQDGTAGGERVFVAFRPEKVRFGRERPQPEPDNVFEGRIADIVYLGDVSLYKIALECGIVIKATRANVTRRHPADERAGERVWLGFDAGACVVLTR